MSHFDVATCTDFARNLLDAKGRADVEEPLRDINYVVGFRQSTGVLGADFEEGAGGASPSLNHPVLGATGHPGEPAAELLRCLGIQPDPQGDQRLVQQKQDRLAELREAMFGEP